MGMILTHPSRFLRCAGFNNNTILEEGDAQPSDGLWWVYMAKSIVNMAGNPQVTAQAYDLAGNVAEMAAGKQVRKICSR